MLPLLFVSNVFSAPVGGSGDVSNWLARQVPISRDRIFAHFRNNGALSAGVGVGYPFPVVDPYEFFWVRDGGISINALATLYEENPSDDIKKTFEKFLAWTKLVQSDDQNQGWTRFDLNTGKHDPNWMSPQYDGFAFRVMGLMKFANASNQQDLFADLIRHDLDGIMLQWQQTKGYEPWEEIQGMHFMTLKVMEEALLRGSKFLAGLGDGKTADLYASFSKKIASKLDSFWNDKWIRSTLNGDASAGNNEGSKMKVSLGTYIDIDVIIGLNFNQESNLYSTTSSKTQATFWSLVDVFKNNAHAVSKLENRLSGSWGLNKLTCSPQGLPLGPAIGRYPEDIYDGTGYEYPGNPDNHISGGAGFWFLATNAMAEFLYKSIGEYVKTQVITIDSVNQQFWSFIGINKPQVIDKRESPKEFEKALELLFQVGDSFLRRTAQHVPKDGFMSEQFHFYSGQQMSTADLTWSYASVITADHFRREAISLLGYEPASATCQPQKAKPNCPIPGQLKDENRKDCAFAGVTVESCVDKGCCWSPVLNNPKNVPWCYYPAA